MAIIRECPVLEEVWLSFGSLPILGHLKTKQNKNLFYSIKNYKDKYR